MAIIGQRVLAALVLFIGLVLIVVVLALLYQ
jgi:hypothetical protein